MALSRYCQNLIAQSSGLEMLTTTSLDLLTQIDVRLALYAATASHLTTDFTSISEHRQAARSYGRLSCFGAT